MRARSALLLAGFASLALAGCNPSAFNSLLDEAPVVVFAPEGPSTSSAVVLPLPMPAEAGTTSAGRMLVSRTDSDYLGVADFDTNGKVTLTEASVTERSSLRGAPVVSAAMRADGMIMLGVPAAGGGPTPTGSAVTLALTPIPGGGYTFTLKPSPPSSGALSHVGLAVAAGNVTGGAAGDFVVVSDNSVHVIGPDGSEVASTGCQSVLFGDATTEYYVFRPIAVGDFFDGGHDEIAIGGKGRVAFLHFNGSTDLDCPTDYLTMGAAVGFGSSLAVADFNADGKADLAVGSPPDKVFVYFYLRDGITTPSVTITSTVPNTKFGNRIAAYQAPGAPPQLLVADPAAPVGNFTGKVMLFSLTAAAMTDADAVVTLFDSREDSDPGLFGTSLGGLAFNTQLCLPGAPLQTVPWVTNRLSVLTYFNYPKATFDPRCFAVNP